MKYTSTTKLTRHILEQKEGEEYKDNIIHHIKRELAIKIALKLLEDDKFICEVVDPNQPFPQLTNPSEMEWMQEKRKQLSETDQIEFTLKLEI